MAHSVKDSTAVTTGIQLNELGLAVCFGIEKLDLGELDLGCSNGAGRPQDLECDLLCLVKFLLTRLELGFGDHSSNSRLFKVISQLVQIVSSSSSSGPASTIIRLFLTSLICQLETLSDASPNQYDSHANVLNNIVDLVHHLLTIQLIDSNTVHDEQVNFVELANLKTNLVRIVTSPSLVPFMHFLERPTSQQLCTELLSTHENHDESMTNMADSNLRQLEQKLYEVCTCL
ncbi:hypothetical protein ACM66B_004392 [Microbotryomycetes sp. NB124-2]